MGLLKRYVKFIATALASLLLLAAAAPTEAQGITVVVNEAAVSFPESVDFQVEVASGVELTEAVLTYDVVHHSCVEVSSEVPVQVEDSSAAWRWVMSRSGNPPPGAELWWEWTLTDTAGERFTTPRQSIVLVDERFPWRTIDDQDISLHWYEGEETGPILLEAAVAGLARLEQEMGIALQEDVDFYIYGSAEDMRQAVLYIQDWAGGVAFAEYNTILIGVPPGLAEGWGRETVRHELAHLVVGQYGWSCLGGGRPTWLEEGLAVYAEGPADAETLANIEQGIEENSFVPLRSLNGSFPSHDRDAELAYSQSYSVVAFLLEQYGQAAMQQLLLTLAEGEAYDTAFERVYGSNIDGIEQLWREAIGAPPRPIPPTATPLRAAAVATFPPLQAPHSQPTPAGLAREEPAAGEPARPVCGLALLPLFLVGLVFVYRRRLLP